jgi:hypothetical protein
LAPGISKSLRIFPENISAGLTKGEGAVSAGSTNHHFDLTYSPWGRAKSIRILLRTVGAAVHHSMRTHRLERNSTEKKRAPGRKKFSVIRCHIQDSHSLARPRADATIQAGNEESALQAPREEKRRREFRSFFPGSGCTLFEKAICSAPPRRQEYRAHSDIESPQTRDLSAREGPAG